MGDEQEIIQVLGGCTGRPRGGGVSKCHGLAMVREDL